MKKYMLHPHGKRADKSTAQRAPLLRVDFAKHCWLHVTSLDIVANVLIGSCGAFLG